MTQPKLATMIGPSQERHSFQKSNYVIPKEITRWWEMGLQDFVKYVHNANGGEGMFAYVKSCQYAEHIIKESEERLCKELKSLIYNMCLIHIKKYRYRIYYIF